MTDSQIAVAFGLLFMALMIALTAWIESCMLDTRPTFNRPRNGDVIVWQSCEAPCCETEFTPGAATDFPLFCWDPDSGATQ